MALTMPKRKPWRPATVTDAMNGSVPAMLLRPVSDGKGALLTNFSLQMDALHYLARQSGIILTTTGRGRSISQQITLFKSRYEPCSYSQYIIAALSGRGKQWTHASNETGHRYWRKKLINGSYPATAASPGTSNHGFWNADDLAEIVNGKRISLRRSTIQWLYANAPKCGIYWELSSEPWHVHNGVSSIPVLVRDILKKIGAGGGAPSPANPPAPTPDARIRIVPPPSMKSGDTDASTVVDGWPRGRVSWLQMLMNQWFGTILTPDGNYGPATVAGVKKMQGVIGATQDGGYGPQTSSALQAWLNKH